MTQKQKHKYLHDLYWNIGQHETFTRDHHSGCIVMRDTKHVSSLYASPGLEQFLYEKDFPDDDNIQIVIDVTVPDVPGIRRAIVDYTLSYDLTQDLNNYVSSVLNGMRASRFVKYEPNSEA